MEFFRQARSTSFYKQFGAFLVNIEELNSQNRTREFRQSYDSCIGGDGFETLTAVFACSPSDPICPFSSSVWWIEIMQLAFGFIQHINKGIHTLNSSLGSFSFVVLQFAVVFMNFKT